MNNDVSELRFRYKEQLENDGAITEDDVIICPWCFYEDGDPWEYNLRDGDEHVIKCPGCGRKMKVTCAITAEFTSSQEEPDCVQACGDSSKKLPCRDCGSECGYE